MIGFETIGNATIICHDGDPILTTDPWLTGSAYFGSWGIPYAIPEEQLENIGKCQYIWLSHGHPDHINIESLDQFREKKILLASHIGNRLQGDLTNLGFNVTSLEERKWIQLSKNLSILTISDYYQDSILLINLNGRLLVNINDASNKGWGKFVKNITKEFQDPFLFKLFSYGDADMINYFYEDGTRIPPKAALKKPVGEQINFWSRYYGIKHIVPSSCFHYYQRKDSSWANQFVTDVSDYKNQLSPEFKLHPAFIKYDLENDCLEEINPKKNKKLSLDPEEFGDNWHDPLGSEEVKEVERYISEIESLSIYIDFINFRVGGKDNLLELNKKNFKRGITFEVPRQSLVNTVKYEIFDDLLIGNFMKTTLHGDWHNNTLYPYFTPYVAKFADNGKAKSKARLKSYLSQYREKSPMEFILHCFSRESEELIRRYVGSNNKAFEWVKKFYLVLNTGKGGR
ncbi:MBL fold metallo-hydrolase [Nitrospinae bacterium]|nr:MBL fold metallo-hydrolase [Nitrospinota bacterium]